MSTRTPGAEPRTLAEEMAALRDAVREVGRVVWAARRSLARTLLTVWVLVVMGVAAWLALR